MKNTRGLLARLPIGVLGASALFAWLFTYQWTPALIPLVVPHHHVTIVGDGLDSRFCAVMLEHGYRWLRFGEDLFSPPFYFPLAQVGGFGDLFIGTLPVYALFRAIGLDFFSATQAWIIVGVIANYVSAYWVARRFNLPWYGATVAAATFTFAPPVSGYAPWYHLLWRFAVPFATLWCASALGRMRAGVRAALPPMLMTLAWLAFAFLCSPYVGILTLVWLGSLTTGIVILRLAGHDLPLGLPEVVSPRGPLLAVAVVPILGAAASAASYARAAAAYAISNPYGATSATPGPWEWLFTQTSIIWLPVSSQLRRELAPPDAGMFSNGPLFPGLAVVGLMFYGLWWIGRHRLPGWTAAIGVSTLLAVLVVTASNHVSLFALLSQLPGFDAVRHPHRIVLELLFPIGLLAGAGFVAATERLAHRAVVAIGVLFVADLTLVFLPASTASDWLDRPAALAVKAAPLVRQVASPVLLVLPGTHVAWPPVVADRRSGQVESQMAQVDAMVAAQMLGIPTLNGYTSRKVFDVPAGLDCSNAKPWLENLSTSLPPQWPRLGKPGEVQVIAVGDEEQCVIDVVL